MKNPVTTPQSLGTASVRIVVNNNFDSTDTSFMHEAPPSWQGYQNPVENGGGNSGRVKFSASEASEIVYANKNSSENRLGESRIGVLPTPHTQRSGQPHL